MIKAIYNNGVLEVINTSDKLINGRELLLEIISDKRTIQQNKYLWKVFDIIGNEWGYSKDDIKELILREINFTRIIINKKTGEEIIKVKETHNLNKVEFSELVENILRFTSEYGLVILTPEEFLKP